MVFNSCNNKRQTYFSVIKFSRDKLERKLNNTKICFLDNFGVDHFEFKLADIVT